MKRSALPRIPRATFEPKINLPTKYSAPDSYDATAGRPPASDFVVSRHIDGAVASRYGEPVWDWTPYNHTGKSSPLMFASWCGERPTRSQLALVEEIHWLMFVLI